MPAKRQKPDPFIEKMNEFANDLIDEARSVKVKSEEGGEAPPAASLQTRLDVFRQLTTWVGVRNRLIEGDPDGGTALDDLKHRLRGPPKPRPFGGGKARDGASRKGLDAAYVRHGANWPEGNGGSALDAIKRALPSADAGDDDDAGDGAER